MPSTATIRITWTAPKSTKPVVLEETVDIPDKRSPADHLAGVTLLLKSGMGLPILDALAEHLDRIQALLDHIESNAPETYEDVTRFWNQLEVSKGALRESGGYVRQQELTALVSGLRSELKPK